MLRNFWLPITFLFLFFQSCSPKYTLDEKILPPATLERPVFEAKEKFFPKTGLIVIDPGHGGEDFGAHSISKPLYHEKNLNLTLAKMLKNILDFQGYQTTLTRKSDQFISLDNRAAYANQTGASLFVSLHFNSAPSQDAAGIEVYYYRSEADQERSKASSAFAKTILDEVIKISNAKSRGVKHGDFAVIRKTKMPAILVEAGFLTNESEMENIKNPVYLKNIAYGISLGVKQYLARVQN